MQQITTKYNFYVRDAKEVDIPRILSEAPTEVTAVLLTTKATQAVLLVRNSWLGSFDMVDQISVANRTLFSAWGEGSLSRYNSRNGVSLETRNGSSLEGWRAAQFSKSSIPAVLKELEAARAFIPRREVRVSYV